MAWIESHQALATHRKTIALCRLLGIRRPQVIGHLHLLWWWCLDNAQSGDLSQIAPEDIAVAMDWPGEASTIITAMMKVGFIDSDMKVHSWDEYAGKLIVRKQANAIRQQQFRDRQTQLLLTETTGQDVRNDNVTVTSQLRNGATVPNTTVPNLTQHNTTKIDFPQKNNCNGFCKKCPKKNDCPDKFTKGKYGAMVQR